MGNEQPEEMKPDDLISEKMNFLKNKLNLIMGYRSIAEASNFLIEGKKNQLTKLDVHDRIVREIKEFCLKKIDEVSKIEEKVSIDVDESETLTKIEIRVLKSVLKSMVQKIITKVQTTEDERIEPPVAPVLSSRRSVRQEKTKGEIPDKTLVEDDVRGKDPMGFVGRKCYITETRGIKFSKTPDNQVPPYSLVRIKTIEDGEADVEFVSTGDVGRCPLNQLAPWEYL
jgi:hypothetical protein